MLENLIQVVLRRSRFHVETRSISQSIGSSNVGMAAVTFTASLLFLCCHALLHWRPLAFLCDQPFWSAPPKLRIYQHWRWSSPRSKIGWILDTWAVLLPFFSGYVSYCLHLILSTASICLALPVSIQAVLTSQNSTSLSNAVYGALFLQLLLGELPKENLTTPIYARWLYVF